MIYTIKEIADKIKPVAEKYGVDSASLFGSYVRGEATDESDIDVYIDKGNITNLFLLSGFVQDLEDILECPVDVVTTGISDKHFLNRIMKYGVLIYKKQ